MLDLQFTCPITSIDMLSPPLSILDSTLYDLGCDDTGAHTSRSRAGTTSTDDSGRAELQHYLDSPQSSPSLTSHSTSTASSCSPYFSSLSSSYLSAPAPAFSPFPELSPETLSGEWCGKDARIQDSPEPYECPQTGSALPDANTAAMRYVHRHVSHRASLCIVSSEPQSRTHPVSNSFPSAAAVSLDSSFPMSSKESFSWPGMMANAHSSANLLGHNLSMAPASDGGYASTGGSHSANASPPRHPLSTEQRELKRQMDQARRDSKSAVRYRRSNSNSYLDDTATTTLNVPAYTSSTPSISLLAEAPTTGVAGQNYLSPYTQPQQEPSSAGLPGVPMYGASMQQQPMHPSYSVPMDFAHAYQQQPSPSYS